MNGLPRIRLSHLALLLLMLPAALAGAPAFAAVLDGVQESSLAASPVLPDTSERRALYLERIEVTGNTRTPEAIILRYISLKSGGEISVDALESDRERLLATDYFTAVEFSTRPGAERGAVVLVVEVKERALASLETGFGYDDLYGWFLTLLGVRVDNTFGIESRFRMGLRVGFRTAGLDAEWDKPVPPEGGFGYVARFHVYNQRNLFYGSGPGGPQPWQGPEWRRFRQDIGRVGAEAALRYRVGDATRFSIGIQAETNKPDSSFTDVNAEKDYEFNELPAEIKAGLGKSTITGFFFRVIRDTRDTDDYPLSGSFARMALEVNNSFLGGDHIFSKAEGDYRKHFPLGGGRVLSSRAGAGIVSDGAPYYDKFYLGGNYSIRGFAEWSLSPPGGDDAFWLVNTELRVPLIGAAEGQPKLTGLLFLDAGKGWRRGDDYSLHRLDSALGYGLRLRLPWVGTLGMDVGVPLSEGRTGDEFRVHALLGFSF